MDRKAFNQCLAQGLKGKKFTKEARRAEFCILAVQCSGKAKDRQEAVQVCLRKHPDWGRILGHAGRETSG